MSSRQLLSENVVQLLFENVVQLVVCRQQLFGKVVQLLVCRQLLGEKPIQLQGTKLSADNYYLENVRNQVLQTTTGGKT